jgi:hypothetical protein
MVSLLTAYITTLVIIVNAHARLSGAWKWISKITELNQLFALESRNVASVQTHMFKLLGQKNNQ